MEVKKTESRSKIQIENLHEIGKNKFKPISKVVEKDLVYPLLRGRDVRAWSAKPSLSIILPYDKDHAAKPYSIDSLRRKFPGVWEYFNSFQQELLDRTHYEAHFAAQGAPFYAVYNVGEYTFAPYKVVWKEQSSPFQCAVISSHQGKVIIPDHKLMLVPFEGEIEAHYVCAALNSSISQFIVQAYTISTQQSTHILENIKIPRYDQSNSCHIELARLSQQCHEKTAAGIPVSDLEAQIDELAAELWGLTPDELKEIQESLREMA